MLSPAMPAVLRSNHWKYFVSTGGPATGIAVVVVPPTPAPLLLMPTTVNVYAVPGVNPATVAKVADAGTVTLTTSGSEVTW